MGAAAAVKKPRTTTKKPPLAAVPSAPGSIVIPGKCKPSQGVSTDRTRPILTHAFLRRRDDGLWVCTTDSYLAVAVKVSGDAEEGYIPIGALRLMEKGQKAEQISKTSWKVWTNAGTVTFDCEDAIKSSVNFPDFDKLGVFDKPEMGELGKADMFTVGFNAAFLRRLSEAMGNESVKLIFTGDLRPIRVLPTQTSYDDRVAMLMPIRVNV